MALPASQVIEVRPTNGLDTNGGGFDPGNVNFPTDLAATSANTASPVVTSASYTFVAGDVGAFVFVKSGTNWTPGFYPIASVAAGAATLTGACATVASPAVGTFGVDYSQQNTAQSAFTDLVIGGTTTNLTSAAKPFGKNHVGNTLQVTAGTGFTAGFYSCVSVSGTTATMDRSVGTAASSSGTGALGGALKTITFAAQASGAAAPMVGSNKIFVKAESTITSTATITLAGTGVVPSNTIMPNRLICYTTTRADGGRVSISLSTNTGLSALSATTNGWWVENFDINCNSLGTSTGIGSVSAQHCNFRNCKVSNFTTAGITSNTANITVDSCEVTGGTSAATAAINLPSSGEIVSNNYVHDNACTGISVSNASSVSFNVVANNTGASSDGIKTSFSATILSNTIHGNGRHGINQVSAPQFIGLWYRNNLLTSNGGFGILGSTGSGQPAASMYDGNAFWNNTSGTRSNMDNVTGVNAAAPYTNPNDVILTASPYTNAAGGDYSLNNTTGGGAAAKGFGVPQTWPGLPGTTSKPSFGAVQPQGGSGTTASAG